MRITEESMNQSASSAAPKPEPPKPEPPRTEREKLKAMTPKDRLWYIWTYYKIYFIGLLVVLAIAHAVAGALYQNSFEDVFYCMYLNNQSDPPLDTAPLESGFSAYLGLGDKQRITTESAFISYDEAANEYSYASMAKISALVASKELDAIIADTASLQHYSALGGMLDLKTHLPADVLTLVQDHLLTFPGEDGQERAYGISLEDTWFADASHLAQDPPIFGIMANSLHKDTAAEFLRYVFGQSGQSPAGQADAETAHSPG